MRKLHHAYSLGTYFPDAGQHEYVMDDFGNLVTMTLGMYDQNDFSLFGSYDLDHFTHHPYFH